MCYRKVVATLGVYFIWVIFGFVLIFFVSNVNDKVKYNETKLITDIVLSAGLSLAVSVVPTCLIYVFYIDTDE